MKTGNKNRKKTWVIAIPCLFLVFFITFFTRCAEPVTTESIDNQNTDSISEGSVKKTPSTKHDSASDKTAAADSSYTTTEDTAKWFTSDNWPLDTLLGEEEFSETLSEESEFYISEILDEPVNVEQLLNERLVKVEILYPNNQKTDKEAMCDNIIEYFNIQQWSTPFKNHHVYQRSQNLLRIKGIDIDSVSVYYINSNYYLEHDAHLCIILNSNEFKNLEASISEEILP